MGNFKVYTYASDTEFVPQKYGDESLIRHSKFHSYLVAKGENVFMQAYARETLLEDESAFLQLGQTSESTFYGLSF